MNRIAHTTLEDGTEVSTIGADGMLVRWPETCLFFTNGDSEVIATYTSPADAFAGHHRIVAELGAKLLTMPAGVKLLGGKSDLRLPRSIVSILRG